MATAPSGQLWRVGAAADSAASPISVTLTVGTDIPSVAKRIVVRGFSAGSTAAGVAACRCLVTLGSTEQFSVCSASGSPSTDLDLPINVVNGSVVTFTVSFAGGTHRPVVWGYWE